MALWVTYSSIRRTLLMTEGGQEAVRADDDVVPAADVRRLEERVRELERQLSRKTLEVEILKEALDASQKKGPCCQTRCRGTVRRADWMNDAHDSGLYGVRRFVLTLRNNVRRSQFTTVRHRRHGVHISMPGKGNCFDNAMVETFFKTLKLELVWWGCFAPGSWPRQLSAITSIASTTPYGDTHHWTLSARPHSRGWSADQNLLSIFLRQARRRVSPEMLRLQRA
jgi:hypothetical protein